MVIHIRFTFWLARESIFGGFSGFLITNSHKYYTILFVIAVYLFYFFCSYSARDSNGFLAFLFLKFNSHK